MPITVVCTCGKSLRAPDHLARRSARCPACKALITVPARPSPGEPTLRITSEEPGKTNGPAQPASTQLAEVMRANRRIAGKTCPICRDKIKLGEDVRNCLACAVPHHLACWTQNGGCSTYGCRLAPDAKSHGLRQEQPSAPEAKEVEAQEGQRRKDTEAEETRALPAEPQRATGADNSIRAIGLLGSFLLFVGVFMPVISVPIVGNLNYFQNGRGDGTIILALSVVSIVLIFSRAYRGLWLTGIASLGLLGFTFVNFHIKMSDARQQMERELAGNPFRGLADLAMESVQLQWGWAVLVVGAVLVIIAAAMPIVAVAGKRRSALGTQLQ